MHRRPVVHRRAVDDLELAHEVADGLRLVEELG
jgi:hypothetical protein